MIDKNWLEEQVAYSANRIKHWESWRLMEEMAVSPTKESTFHIGYPKHRGTNHMKEFIESWRQ